MFKLGMALFSLVIFISCQQESQSEGSSKSMVAFDKLSSTDLLLLQLSRSIEFHRHFDLLEAASAPHQHLADEVVAFIIQAQIVVHIDFAFDGLAATVTFHIERVEIGA